LRDVTDSKVLKLPYRGAPQTVDVMRRAALESQNRIVVRRLAEWACQGVDSKDYISEYIALYNVMIQRTRYMRDPRTVELVRAPYLVCEEILDGGRPSLDCDDVSATLGALILAVGGPCSFVTAAFKDVFFQGRRQYSHVWARAQAPNGVWINVDPVAADKTADMLRRVRAAAIWPVA